MFSIASIAQDHDDLSKKMPPVEMLKGEPENVTNIYELPHPAHYIIHNQKGEFIDSGYAEFINYTDYKPGKYFIKYDGKTHWFERKRDFSTENKEASTESNGDSTNYISIVVVNWVLIIVVALLLFYGIYLRRIKKDKLKLMQEIQDLKNVSTIPSSENLVNTNEISLNRKNIETKLAIKLNESDWKIINQLLEHPSISNKDLAEKVSLSVEGTRSALKKMYRIFEIPSSRNMRLTLVIKLVHISKQTN